MRASSCFFIYFHLFSSICVSSICAVRSSVPLPLLNGYCRAASSDARRCGNYRPKEGRIESLSPDLQMRSGALRRYGGALPTSGGKLRNRSLVLRFWRFMFSVFRYRKYVFYGVQARKTERFRVFLPRSPRPRRPLTYNKICCSQRPRCM